MGTRTRYDHTLESDIRYGMMQGLNHDQAYQYACAKNGILTSSSYIPEISLGGGGTVYGVKTTSFDGGWAYNQVPMGITSAGTGEIYQPYNQLHPRTRHQDEEISYLRDELHREKSNKLLQEVTEEQKLKDLIAEYYRK